MKGFIFVSFAIFISVTCGIIIPVPYGKILGTSSEGVDRFLGLAYTEGPTPRFTRGVPINVDEGSTKLFNGTSLGPICPQLKVGDNSLVVNETLCLNLNVVRPQGTNASSKLPVMVYIFGGAFVVGSAQRNADKFVAHSASINQPVIHVAMNYRLNAFGFLASKQMKAENLLNLGLQDQILALKWVKKYISFFGGDPQKVTVYGQSAGSISIGYHIQSPKNKGLFRAAIMESGSPTSIVVPPVSEAQDLFFFVAKAVGCGNVTDVLECMKHAKQDAILNAARFGYVYWGTRASPAFGPVLSDLIPFPPSQLMKSGKFLQIPILAGEVRDEGTLFVKQYDFINDTSISNFFKPQTPKLPEAAFQQILKLYPSDPQVGSPYYTGDRIYFSNQFKRAASILGDVVFSAARRFTVQTLSVKSPVWTYRFEFVRNSSLIDTNTYVGVSHSSELAFLWLDIDNPLSKVLATYWISFANSLDPNPKSPIANVPQWDRYNNITIAQMSFGNDGAKMVKDDYRVPQMEFFNQNLKSLLR